MPAAAQRRQRLPAAVAAASRLPAPPAPPPARSGSLAPGSPERSFRLPSPANAPSQAPHLQLRRHRPAAPPRPQQRRRTPAPAVAAAGAAAGFAAVATAEGGGSGPARTEPTPARCTRGRTGRGRNGSSRHAAGQPADVGGRGARPQPAAQAPSQPGATLQPQLAKPLFTLAGAPHGQHIMTLKVSPEDLGPMTVRAHIDAAGVRIELFAPGDAGREAIRGILPELRKELADAGFGASLDVSDHSGPGTTAQDGAGQDPAGQNGTGRGGSGPGPDNPNGRGEPRTGHRWDALADGAALRNARILNGPQTTLDILV